VHTVGGWNPGGPSIRKCLSMRRVVMGCHAGRVFSFGNSMLIAISHIGTMYNTKHEYCIHRSDVGRFEEYGSVGVGSVACSVRMSKKGDMH
jgi:hypothetical protein